jgi:signal peptidase I
MTDPRDPSAPTPEQALDAGRTGPSASRDGAWIERDDVDGERDDVPEHQEDARHHSPAEHGTPAEGAHRERDGSRRRRRRSSGILAWVRETAIVVVCALVLSVLIKTFLVQAFYIPSGSMEETLEIGDRIMVSKLTPGLTDVERGDIVVFVDPGGWLDDVPENDGGPVRNAITEALTFVGIYPQDAGHHLIKRVIGLPGDTVACCTADGNLTVNGVEIDEPYLAPGAAPSRMEFEIVVPEDSLWVMGDNRDNSADSRAHLGQPGGPFVPIDNVVGTAFVTVWPLSHITWHSDPDETFDPVPDP